MKFSRIALGAAASMLAIATTLGLGAAPAMAQCQLTQPGSKIKHIIYIQFDNVHFTRDNLNVPSDLEQMPNLLNFLKNDGTFSTNHHAVLISHTANDILTSLTGVYSDRHGINVANSFGVFDPTETPRFPSSFFYWTDLVSDVLSSTGDHTFGMLTEGGMNVPAPWVPFTRAGCNVGQWSVANTVIERAAFDVPKIFGAGSPEALDPNKIVNYEGAAVHCAAGDPLCTSSATVNAVADLLPDEPGFYNGFKALFGVKYLNAALGQLRDIDGSAINAFPSNFSPSAAMTLGVVAQMQESGIPVTFAYIADAHDDRVNGVAFGPGQAGYVAQLAAYNDAFGKFFARLQSDGITPSNTLFIITADEGDHFVGGAPTPANCDGVTIPCSYSQIGEFDLNLNQLVANNGNSTPFGIHFDDAPAVFINGNPLRTSTTARALEQLIGTLTAVNPITGNTDQLAVAMADPVEEQMLHMVVPADPARTPSFTMFGDPDYFFQSTGSASPVEAPGFAWNHGDIQPEIGTLWLGMVGPGVKQLGQTGAIFSDHTDIRPTMLALAGLTDDYEHDGRVLFEAINESALPVPLRGHKPTIAQMAALYKQINAPFGQLAMDSLVVSTRALESVSPGDVTYAALENDIASWVEQRDALATQMKAMLDGAAFSGQKINEPDAKNLIVQAQTLLNQVHTAAQ